MPNAPVNLAVESLPAAEPASQPSMLSSVEAERQSNFGIGESGKEDETKPFKREPALKQQTGAVRRDQVPPKLEAEKVGFIRRILRFVFGKTSSADSPP